MLAARDGRLGIGDSAIGNRAAAAHCHAAAQADRSKTFDRPVIRHVGRTCVTQVDRAAIAGGDIRHRVDQAAVHHGSAGRQHDTTRIRPDTLDGAEIDHVPGKMRDLDTDRGAGDRRGGIERAAVHHGAAGRQVYANPKRRTGRNFAEVADRCGRTVDLDAFVDPVDAGRRAGGRPIDHAPAAEQGDTQARRPAGTGNGAEVDDRPDATDAAAHPVDRPADQGSRIRAAAVHDGPATAHEGTGTRYADNSPEIRDRASHAADRNAGVAAADHRPRVDRAAIDHAAAAIERNAKASPRNRAEIAQRRRRSAENTGTGSDDRGTGIGGASIDHLTAARQHHG